MAEDKSENNEKIWKKFLRMHWKLGVLFVIGTILAVIGSIFVYLWFVIDAQLSGLIPETLNLWTMGYFITFLLHLIFWEILFIGIPVIIAIVAIIFLWWKRLPEEEKKEYRHGHLFGKRSRSTEGGEGISFLIFIAFCIKVYIDGNWDVPILSWTLDYIVDSMITILVWSATIFGIPAIVIALIWLNHEMKKEY